MENKQDQPAKFETLMVHIKSMHSRYFHALTAFFAYEALREVVAPNIVGESEAQNNSEVIDNFKNFFIPSREALRVYFFFELAKLFDSSKQALHINKIINYTESNLKGLTVEAFSEYNQRQDRTFLEELTKEYRGVAYADLMEIKSMLSKHRVSLEKLDVYRNKWLAHDDVNRPDPPLITGDEINALFDVLAKILNSLTSKLNSETWTYSHVEDDVKHHTRMVIEYLRRFEPYRLKEINGQYHRELEQYKANKHKS